MRILIIGGTNFMGPHVVRRLHALGHELLLFHRGRTQAKLPSEIGRVHGDRQELAQYADELQRYNPQLVLDMVPFIADHAQVVIEIFQNVAQRVVAISSQDVYQAYGKLIGTEFGPPEPTPLTEESPLREKRYPYRGENPRSPDDPLRWLDDYDKIPIEQIIMHNPHLSGTVLRLPMVYGPQDKQHRLFGYLKRMDDDRPAIILGAGQYQWRANRGYVENVAEAIVLAVTDKKAAGRIYNVGEIYSHTEAEWVSKIANAVGWSGRVLSVPSEKLPPHLASKLNTQHQMTMDCDRIRNELGYTEPIALDQALWQTVKWERANSPPEIDPDRFNYAAEDQLLADL